MSTDGDQQQARLSRRQEQAALLLARGDTTQEDVARALHITPETLSRWKHRPEFLARIAQEEAAIQAAVRAEGIANRQNRLRAYNARWEGMQRIIAARATSPTPQEENQERGWGDDDDEPPAPVERIPVPGWDTGLLVKSVRMMGKAIEIRYEVDGTLLKELRDLEKQAAQDVGQWTEKVEHAGEMTLRRFIGVNTDEV